MNEEEHSPVVMDKTKARVPSTQPKGNGSVCRKDNSNFKNGRGGWRKEPLAAKSREAKGSRAYSQKGRPFDRRPRPRENCSYGQEEEMSYDHGSNFGSKSSGKKKNLNHLLNFSMTARESESYSGDKYEVRSTTSAKYKRWHNRKSAVKYNKEQFLQANCQFLVKEDDYSAYLVDPDILVDWDHIEQIRVFSHDVPCCPICLYPPVAAKITRCGHIYCWRCMLHYLSLSDGKTWRKCPICYEAVHQKDLKSVTALKTRMYKCGDTIEMRLMKRSKDSTNAMPSTQWDEQHCQPYALKDGVNLSFSKLVVASPQDVEELVIGLERTALQTQLAEDGETSLEGSFVKAALELLKEREMSVEIMKAGHESACQGIKGQDQGSSTTQPPKNDESTAASATRLSKDAVHCSCAFSDEEAGPACPETEPALDDQLLGEADRTSNSRPLSESSCCSASELSDGSASLCGTAAGAELMSHADGQQVHVTVDEAAEELAMPEVVPTKGVSPPKENAFYFYQASDGQQIYLHSLNARALVHEYGSLQKCPETICARIVEMEGITMNEELRGRLRYLNHLPLTCEFEVVELALKPPTISKATLQQFADDIERRQRQRNKKSRDERRKLKQMHQQQMRKYENNPEMRVLMSSSYLPEVSSTIVKSEMPQLLEADNIVAPTLSTAESMLVGSPTDSVTSDSGQGSLSFAQMLRAGKVKAKAADWPVMPGDSCASSPPWRSTPSGDSEGEDSVPVPTFRSSFSDAIKTALDKYDKQPGSEVSVVTPVPAVQSQASGKKKKNKKTLLFTTSMARTN